MFILNHHFNVIKSLLESKIVKSTKSILFSPTIKIEEPNSNNIKSSFNPCHTQKTASENRRRKQNNYKQNARKDSQSTEKAYKEFLMKYKSFCESNNLPVQNMTADKFFNEDLFEYIFDIDKFPALARLKKYNIAYIKIGLTICGSPKVSELSMIIPFHSLISKKRCIFCGRKIENESKRCRYYCNHCEPERSFYYKITQAERYKLEHRITKLKENIEVHYIKDVNQSSLLLKPHLSLSKAIITETNLTWKLTDLPQSITISAKESLENKVITVTTTELDKTIEYNVNKQESVIKKDIEITYSTTAQTTISIFFNNFYESIQRNSIKNNDES